MTDDRERPPFRLNLADFAVRSFSCECRHPDARSCLMMRAGPGAENDPPEGERCGCRCHGAKGP